MPRTLTMCGICDTELDEHDVHCPTCKIELPRGEDYDTI